MTIRYTERHDAFIAHFEDAKIANELRIQDASTKLVDVCRLAASAGKKFFVDFGGVQFMTSRMIGELVLVREFAEQHAVQLRFINPGPGVREVFKITGIPFDDNEGPDMLGSPIPLPKPPDQDCGQAEPPTE